MSEASTDTAVEALIDLAGAVESALSAKESPALLVEQVTSLEAMVVERQMSRRVIEAVRALKRQVAKPSLPGLAIGAARRVKRLIENESAPPTGSAFPRKRTNPGVAAPVPQSGPENKRAVIQRPGTASRLRPAQPAPDTADPNTTSLSPFGKRTQSDKLKGLKGRGISAMLSANQRKADTPPPLGALSRTRRPRGGGSLLDSEFLDDLEQLALDTEFSDEPTTRKVQEPPADSGVLELGLPDLDEVWNEVESHEAPKSPSRQSDAAIALAGTPKPKKGAVTKRISAPPTKVKRTQVPSPLPRELPPVKPAVAPPGDARAFEPPRLDSPIATPALKKQDFRARPKSGPNELSFDEISDDIDNAFDLSFLTSADDARRQKKPTDDPYAGFEDIDLQWLDNEELYNLDGATAQETEPSGIIDLEFEGRSKSGVKPISAPPVSRSTTPGVTPPPAPSRPPPPSKPAIPVVARIQDVEEFVEIDVEAFEVLEPGLEDTPPPSDALLPDGGGKFEDSGLFLVFVDEDVDDSMQIEIDVIASEQTEAAQAYRSFVRHVERILVRLCDSLELALLGKQYDELIDVERQLNRLARILDFVELDRQISLLVYIQDRLPVRTKRWGLGDPTRLPPREVPPAALARFERNVGEVLNCLLYLFGYLVHEIPGLDRDRYERAMVELYAGVGLEPGNPSMDAPTGPYGHADGLKLTSRTRAMLARGFEGRLSYMLDAAEAAMLHGDMTGYPEAHEVVMEMLRVAEDHGLPDVSVPLARMSKLFSNRARNDRPGRELIELGRQLCDGLTPILPTFKPFDFVDRVQTLVNRVNFGQRPRTDKQPITKRTSAPTSTFDTVWPRFRVAANAELDLILGLTPDVLDGRGNAQESVRRLKVLAQKHNIDLLNRLFGAILSHWARAPHACAVVVEDLAASIRALPEQNTKHEQLETLARSVVDDLVRKRTAPTTTTHAATQEHETRILKLVTRADQLAKAIKGRLDSGKLEDLDTFAKEARATADEARSQDLFSVGLACDVVGEVAGWGGEPSTAPPGFEAQLYAAEGHLSRLLNNLVDRIDDFETGTIDIGNIDFWFLPFVETKDGNSHNVLLDRALIDTAQSNLRILDAVWASIPPNTLPSGDARQRYQSALDVLHQLSWYWGNRQLFELVGAHRDLSSTEGQSSSTARAQYDELSQTFASELPIVTPVALNTQGQKFAAAAFALTNRMLRALDGGDEHWTGVASDGLAQLSPMAHASMYLPFVGLTAELHSVVVEAASDDRSTIADARVQRLLYWMNRVLCTLAPEWIHAEQPHPRATADPTARIHVDDLTALRDTLEAMGRRLAEVDTLLEGGPLKIAGKQGRAAIESMRTLYARLSTTLNQASPAQLQARLDIVAMRITQRARLQGKPLVVQVDVTDRRSSQKVLDPREQLLIEAALAGLETLAEGVIDHGFEVGDDGGALAFDVEVEGELARVTLTHNASALDTRSVRRALESVGARGGGDLLQRLVSRPDAMKLVSGGGALAMADAQLARIDAVLNLESEPGWTVYSVDLPLTAIAKPTTQTDSDGD